MVRFEAEDFEKAGVLVREGAALEYPGWSRVTVGDSWENDRVIAALDTRREAEPAAKPQRAS